MFRNIFMCVSCDLKFSKRETILIHIKTHEDEFDGERMTLTDTSCPECNSVSMRFGCIAGTRNFDSNISNLL